MKYKGELISVIIPCYNVEKYVEKAIDSIINQTYKNIEIIAIDDCSTDNTYSKLVDLRNKYEDKIILEKNDINSGAAFTRNKALKLAKGNFIGFIDPDDYIDEKYYENLYSSLIKNKSWISVTDIVLVDEKDNILNGPIKCCYGDEINIENMLNCGLVASPCNKLFKKDVILKYPFLEGKMNEDVASIIPALVYSKNHLSYADGIKYYYVQRKDSAQNSDFSEKRFDMFESISVCLDLIKNEKEFKKYSDIILFHQVLMLYTCIILEIKDSKIRKKMIKLFVNKAKQYKLYNNSMIKEYVKNQRKVLRLFYYLEIKLLVLKNGSLLNFIVDFKNWFYDFCRVCKNTYKRINGSNVIKINIGIKDVIKAAKKQNKLKENNIKVSVVVPNYNYEKFMYQRIFSILNQNTKIHELIILDDCSTDNSRELIDNMVENIKGYVNVKKIYNDQNSGTTFKQWKKGFKEANGDYIWIAEADDYCSNKMLSKLISKIEFDKDIQIAYVDTAFIDKYGNIMLKTIKNEIDIMKTGHWNSSFIDDGKYEIEKYCFLNCIIANVSSCLIKKDNYDDIFEKILEYRQAGDWLFYNLVMLKGKICYIDESINYYRVHGNNVTSNTKKQKHFDEIVKIHEEMRKLIKMDEWHEQEINKRYDFLEKVWNIKK